MSECNSTPESTGIQQNPHSKYTAATAGHQGFPPSCSLLNQKTMETWTSAVGNEDWLTKKNDIRFMETEQEEF